MQNKIMLRQATYIKIKWSTRILSSIIRLAKESRKKIWKLKELILENHSNYINYVLKDKIKTVKGYAKFNNDTDLLEFLEFMEK